MGGSSARIPVDPIEGLHVLGFPVTRLALLVVALGIGARFTGERPGYRDRNGRAGAQRAKELTTTQRLLRLFFHCAHPPMSDPAFASLTTAARRPRFRSR